MRESSSTSGGRPRSKRCTAFLRATLLLLAVLPLVAWATPAYGGPNTVRRFLNLTNGAHFWSASGSECAAVLANYPSTYRYEGMAWTIESSQVSNPLYRAYNTSNGTHFYTANYTEYMGLPPNYSKEGVAYYVSTTYHTGYSTVYRAYNTSNGAHFYTSSYSEFIGLPTWFVKEGPAFYFPAASPIVNRYRRWGYTSQTWPTCRVYVNYQPLPDGDWETAAYSARMEWNNSGRTNMYFYFADSTGQNRIVQGNLGRGPTGVTILDPPTGDSSVRIVGATTTVNTYFAWSADGSPLGYEFDLQSLITHELGHWVEELDDYSLAPAQYWPWATMYGVSTQAAMHQRTLAAEDIDGIRSLYGPKP